MLCGLLIATGCNQPAEEVTDGIVIHRKYVMQHEEIELGTVVNSDGSVGTKFDFVTVPDTYTLVIKRSDGRCRTLDVTRQVYSRYKLGDHLIMYPPETVVDDEALTESGGDGTGSN